MPEFMISDGEAPPKYARIAPDGRSCSWSDEAQASAFPTAELAREAFDKACQGAIDKARAKLAACQAAGSIKADPHSYRDQFAYGSKRAREPILLFLPHWIHYHWEGKTAQTRAKSFPAASRPLPGDLLEVFEAFYVRSSAGWLGRAETRRQGASLAWRDSFAFAVAFSSREEALANAGPSATVVTASCVFTAIEPASADNAKAVALDPVVQSIGAACEARDIRGAIEESAKARLADAAAPSRPSARL